MKVLLDACVLYPTVMREMLLGAAGAGLYDPRWSPRILEEWARAAARLGPGPETVARGEIALVSARFPAAAICDLKGQEARLWLPDPNDIHVLAAAVAGSADLIVTLNARDFPRAILAEVGLRRADPDAFLCDLHQDHPGELAEIAARTLAEARRLSGGDWSLRALLKKARLPRLGKALGA